MSISEPIRNGSIVITIKLTEFVPESGVVLTSPEALYWGRILLGRKKEGMNSR